VQRSIVLAAILGAVFSLLGIFPVAGIWAFLGKIPVPFDGWRAGWEGLSYSPSVVLFVGVAMGGIPALIICGAIGGAGVQSTLGKPNLRYVAILAVSLLIDVLLMATAVVCGPW
jgi:hypothetical protein